MSNDFVPEALSCETLIDVSEAWSRITSLDVCNENVLQHGVAVTDRITQSIVYSTISSVGI